MLRRRLLAATLALATGVGAAPAFASDLHDPGLTWRTIETEHFRINYPVGEEIVAGKIASMAEDIHQRVSGYLHTEPPFKVEIVVDDSEDSSNGLALPDPNDLIFIYPTSPSPTDPGYDWKLSLYDDWLRLVLTHEYTHILHFNTTDGPIGWVDRVLGKVITPAVILPNFLKEGFGVFMETRFSRGGRGVDGDFDMYLRQAALEDNLETLDQASSNNFANWPGGLGAYVYGWAFFRYLACHYGQDAPMKFIHAISVDPLPFGDHIATWIVFGKPLYQLWDDMIADLKARAAREQNNVLQRGPLTDLKRLTTNARYHRQPHWLPDGSLLYTESNGHRPGHLVRDRLDGHPAEHVFNKGSLGAFSVSKDGRYVYYSRSAGTNEFNTWSDLYRYDLTTKGEVQLTHGLRALDPAISPDGTKILAVTNGAGQNDLVLLDAEGKLIKRVFEGRHFEQLSEPVWSPDGTKVVISAWRRNSRDLYWVDLETGGLTALWRDPAADVFPAWSPDGQYLLYTSDRTGVHDLHAFRVADGTQYTVTNVVGGVFEPAVSPDGKTIAMAGYGSKGYDIYTMPYDPTKWAKEIPERGGWIPEPTAKEPDYVGLATASSAPYTPWGSLRPKALQITTSNLFSLTNLANLPAAPTVPAAWLPSDIDLSIGQWDALHEHEYALGLSYFPVFNVAGVSASYTNHQTPVDLAFALTANAPSVGAVVLDPSQLSSPTATPSLGNQAVLVQQSDQFTMSVTYPPILFTLEGNQWVQGSAWTVTGGVANRRNTEVSRYVPGSTAASASLQPLTPIVAGDIAATAGQAGLGGTLGVFWRESSTVHYPFAFGASRGDQIGLGLTSSANFANPGQFNTAALLGEYKRFWGGFREDDVWALHLQANAGLATTFFQAPGLVVGGYNAPWAGGVITTNSGFNLEDLRTENPTPLVLVHGQYPARVAYVNGLVSGEYRFPLPWVGDERNWLGWAPVLRTIPIFFEHLNGAVIADLGSGYDGTSVSLLPAVAAELRTPVDINSGLPQLLIGPLEFRLGVGTGLPSLGGAPVFYFATGASF